MAGMAALGTFKQAWACWAAMADGMRLRQVDEQRLR